MERYSRKVYYYETDRMGIVHNANYLRIFEEARIDFMDKAGVPYPGIEAAGVIIPVTESAVQYKQSLVYGDAFYVDVKLASYNGVRMKLSYEVRRAGDELLIATGNTEHCFLEDITRVPVNLKKRLPEESEKIASVIEQ